VSKMNMGKDDPRETLTGHRAVQEGFTSDL
jgi:hypothetical protein